MPRKLGGNESGVRLCIMPGLPMPEEQEYSVSNIDVNTNAKKLEQQLSVK